MQGTSLEIINELQNIKINNNFENQNLNLLSPNKKNSNFISNNFSHCYQTINEKIIFEEFKNIMDNSNKPDIKDEESSELIYFNKPQTIKNEFQTTFNTSKILSLNEGKENYFTKNINFKTILHHKRGKKIQRKIQVNYITFLIRLANDAIKTVFGKKTKYFFKDIKYGLKKVVSHKYVEYLKTCKYSDIIQMKISSKIKNYGENLNKDTFIKICEISPILKDFFEKNYLYIFQKFYCKLKDNQNIIDFDGFQIKLSPLTKGFLYLLRKNESTKERFNSVMKDVYFSGFIYEDVKTINNSNPFITINSNLKEKGF